MRRASLLLTFSLGLALASRAAGAPATAAPPWVLNPPGLEYVRFGQPGEDGAYNIHCTRDGGYIVAGCVTTPGRQRDFSVLKLRADLSLDPAFGAGGRWALGGTGDDQAVDVVEIAGATAATSGYLVVGYTNRADGDFAGHQHHGKIDIVLARLTAAGALDTTFGRGGLRLYGGSDDDEVLVHLHNYSEPGVRLRAVADGFVVAGMTRSRDGELAGIATVGTAQNRDVMLFKVDARGEYARDFGDRGILRIGTKPGTRGGREPNDFVWSLKPDTGGGLVAVGYHLGSGIEVDGGNVPSPGNLSIIPENRDDRSLKHQMDGWVFRVDTTGRLRTGWARHGFAFVGGSRQEKIYDVEPTADAGYVVTGRTASWDLQFARPQGVGEDFDMVLAKLDAAGRPDARFGRNGCVFVGGTEGDQGLRIAARGEDLFWLGQSASPPPALRVQVPPEFFRQIVVLQLGPSGEWRGAWNLGGPGEEKATGLALDSRGRVLVTGYHDATVFAEQDDKQGAARDVFVMRLTVPPAPR